MCVFVYTSQVPEIRTGLAMHAPMARVGWHGWGNRTGAGQRGNEHLLHHVAPAATPILV